MVNFLNDDIYLLFFKGKSSISKAIRFFTWGKYSHVSLIYKYNIYEAWWPDGVRKCTINELNHSQNTHIDVYKLNIDVTTDDKFKLIQFFDEQVGKDYDLPGIFGFLTRRKFEKNDRWFCSELITYGFNTILKKKIINAESYKVSPTILSYSPYLDFVEEVVYKDHQLIISNKEK